MAFTIRCIAGSSVGAPAPFRARTAGMAVSLRKALALPAGSRRAAASASCASAAASATRPRTVASCAWRRALACPGPSPLSAWHGTAGSAKGGGGWGSGREHVRQVRNGCGVPQVQVDPQKGTARRARAFVRGGVCPLDAPVQGLLLCAPARARGRFGPGARGHLGTPRAPVGGCRRCGGHRVTFPAESAGLWEVGGRRPRVEMAEPEVIPFLSEGVPDLQQAGADAAPGVPAERLPLDLPPRVVW